PPDVAAPEWQDEHSYFAALATLRAFAGRYLVFGRALREPTIVPTTSADRVSIRLLRKGVATTLDEPRILGRAWFDSVGQDVGHAFTNYATTSARCSFTFRPSDWPLLSGVRYKLQLARLDGVWMDVPSATFDGGAASVTLGPISIPALE